MKSFLHQKLNLSYGSKKIIYPIVGFGIILRLAQYLSNRSLWLDEAMLALNIIDRSFLELFRPLSYHQGAPIGFLMLEKLAVQLFNNSEYTLRLVPLVLGITSIFVFYDVAKRIIKPGAVPIAVSLFAISAPLVYYASEVKQYSTDVFITTILLYFTIGSIPSKKLFDLHTISIGLLGAVAVWFSHPALFVLAGIGVGNISFLFIKKNWEEIGQLSIT